MTQLVESDPQAGLGIEIDRLTKRFGSVAAVDDLSFTVAPGRVTGFLGPNGAGKTTTLRMLLGLVKPTSGTATLGGKNFVDLADPLAHVGAALEATNFHPGRSGRDHLRVLAAATGIDDAQVDRVIDMVGMTDYARRRAGGYSMGMRQRLGLAAALLGDPQVLILDEPANGLDPEGIRWLRTFLRAMSHEQGKTVLVSSHLLQEVEQTVDDVVIIARGRLVRSGAMDDLRGEPRTLVRTRDPDTLATALGEAGLRAEVNPADQSLIVATEDLKLIGDTALAAAQPIWELTGLRTDLEQLFLHLTGPQDDVPPTPGATAVASEENQKGGAA